MSRRKQAKPIRHLEDGTTINGKNIKLQANVFMKRKSLISI